MSAQNQSMETSCERANSVLAVVLGEPLLELPTDLYIPPDALRVFLEAFEGPLDLLLYLIRKQNIDILNIPIAEVTRQYIHYIELMKLCQFELAADYLVMAASLAEIKSRLLLPRSTASDEDVADPRAELVQRLQAYEQFKRAAKELDSHPHLGRDFFPAQAKCPPANLERPEPTVTMDELLLALRDVMKRADMFEHHNVKHEALSVRERMSQVMAQLSAEHYMDFVDLFCAQEGRAGVIVTFLALLELLKNALIELVQHAPLSDIHVKLV